MAQPLLEQRIVARAQAKAPASVQHHAETACVRWQKHHQPPRWRAPVGSLSICAFCRRSSARTAGKSNETAARY